MKSTKITISNEKTTVSLPTVDELKNSNNSSIGVGQSLVYFPAINKLGIGFSSSVSIHELEEYSAEVDGVQYVDLPDNVAGVLDIKVLEVVGICRCIYQKHYSISDRTLTIAGGANIKNGDKICGSYYLGGSIISPSIEGIDMLDVQGDDSIMIINVISN